LGIRIALLLSVLPLILLGLTDNAFAGNPQAGSDTADAASTQVPISQIIDGDDGTSVSGTVGACDPVSSCPPIVKDFTFVGEGSSNTFFLHEEWTVAPFVNSGPPLDWWDWHEAIQSPGWTFQAVQIEKVGAGGNCPTVGAITNPLPSSVFMNGNQVVWIDFADNIGLVQPGETLCIWKELIPPNPGFTGQLLIYEWPTIHKRMAVGGEFIPIDATAVLIAGAQTNALSVLGAFVVIGAISFGALYISVKRKRN